ncbi:zinc finger protein 436-like isoform X2 [Pseudophryne corroboree]|uniref:zinc finger protein 436-like isoform X2 n=1 Tax=Pseudophryne corroboree TaxID=495146 RepID=UPI003081F421
MSVSYYHGHPHSDPCTLESRRHTAQVTSPFISPTKTRRVQDFMMGEDRIRMTEKILHITMEIIYLLTGEDYILVKNASGKRVIHSSHPCVSGGLSRSQSPIPVPPPHSLTHERHSDQNILELAVNIIQLLTGEVPIRCEDVTVYFSMEEWEYIEEHRGLYKDMMMENHRPLTSLDGTSNRNTPERCPRPLYSQDHTEENHSVPQEDQGEDLIVIKIEDLKGEEMYVWGDQCKEEEISTHSTDRSHMTEKILSLTLEIIYLLTDEDYTVVKKTSRDLVTPTTGPHVSGGLSRTQSPITVPPPHILIHKRHNDQKILELTNKIIQLLTGEVPIRCEDVTVYFSMEEWEYIEEHRGLYKDVMMENHRPLTSLDGTSNRNTPERCPRPLYSQDHTEENHSVPQEGQRKDLTDLNAEDIEGEEETYVIGDPQCKEEEIPTDISTGNKSPSEKHWILFPVLDQDDGADTSPDPSNHEEYSPDSSDITTHCAQRRDGNIPPRPPSGKCLETVFVDHQSTQASERPIPCSECGKCFSHASHFHRHQRSHTGEKPFPCVECGKCFTQKAHLQKHQRVHTGERPFPCSECGKCFPQKIDLATHQRIHTGEKPFPCPDCGRRFRQKSDFIKHRMTHTGDKPFPCSECGKCFVQKRALINHQRIHTGERPFPCSECGKCFTQESAFVRHLKIHTDQRPFLCSECGKCFREKSDFVKHQMTHTGEKPFPCSECGKSFVQKRNLINHQRTHTGEKPFPCPECGRCFTQESDFVRHQEHHTGEKSFPCSECGELFVQKRDLVSHQRTHTGQKPFACPECGKGFTQEADFARHRKIHTSQKLLLCCDCGKRFTHVSHFERHQRSHTGEKPFTCAKCGKSFAQKIHLQKHQRVHTG